MSWQIIKKTSGLFDSATKYKSVFLATIKGGASFVSGEILLVWRRRRVRGERRTDGAGGTYVHVPPVAGKVMD